MRHAVEDDARDLLDEVDLARDVARAPRRHGHLATRRRRSKPRRSRIARCSSSGDVEPDQRARALGPERRPRVAPGRPAWTSARPSSSAPARSTSSLLASTAAGSAAYGSTPFSQRFEPSVRSAEPLGGAQDADRLEVRRLEQHLGRLLRHLGVEAAHDRRERDGLLAVGDQQVGGSELALRAVERPQLLPRRARGGRRSARRRASSGRRRAAGCPRRASRSS